MALVSVQLVHTQSYSVDQGKTRQATDFYLVRFDASVAPIDAEQAAGVPGYGTANAIDPTRLFKQKRATCIDNSNRLEWMVQVDWDSTADANADPKNKPAEISWDYSDGTETYAFDHADLYPESGLADPQFTCNSAGQNFEHLLEREAGRWSATYTKNVPTTYNIASKIPLMQHVNNADFTFDGHTIAKYAAKLSGGGLSPIQVENGYQFRVLTLKLKFLDGGWIQEEADVGYEANWDIGGGEHVLAPIVTSKSGEPASDVKKPWPLDGSGQPKANADDEPAKLKFYPYVPSDFSGLFPS